LNALTEGVHGRFEFGLHAGSGHALPNQLSGLFASQDGTNDSVFIANAFDIGKKDKGFGCEG
jgi:hypothetical protein